MILVGSLGLGFGREVLVKMLNFSVRRGGRLTDSQGEFLERSRGEEIFMDDIARKCNKYYVSIYTIKIIVLKYKMERVDFG